MKAFYTKEELKVLSKEELIELTHFEGENGLYNYGNVSRTGEEDGVFFISYIIDGITKKIYTDSEEKYVEVVAGKARYDLISSSLEDIDEVKKEREELKDYINNTINSEMAILKNNRIKQEKEIKNLIEQAKKETQSTIKYIESVVQNVDQRLIASIDNVDKKLSAKIDSFDELDAEKIKDNLDKMDKIISSFDELMED